MLLISFYEAFKNKRKTFFGVLYILHYNLSLFLELEIWSFSRYTWNETDITGSHSYLLPFTFQMINN